MSLVRDHLLVPAIEFFKATRDDGTPVAAKVAFLLSEGLTEDEIVEAARLAGRPQKADPPLH